MFDIGWSEMLVIAVVLIVVVGPSDLPRVLRSFGKYAGQLRRMAGDFQRQVNDAMREAELDDVRRDIESVRRIHPASQVRSMLTGGESKDDAVMEPLPAPAGKDAPVKITPAVTEPAPAPKAKKAPSTKKAPAAKTPAASPKPSTKTAAAKPAKPAAVRKAPAKRARKGPGDA
ncbi:MAG: twin-arginine translocase subunit TatB [Rhodobiaceae bacterium]|nr:twin-arginine translocase subunit TatB [Rhodobiaceae bacterium]MCC0057052.1 twin-arginine translocase subunit TatB [Rhodobiaceae bacterium]